MQWLKFNQKGSMLAKNGEDKHQYERISLRAGTHFSYSRTLVFPPAVRGTFVRSVPFLVLDS